MKDQNAKYTIAPFPRMRQLVLDAGWMGRRRHTIHGLVEVDITQVRQEIREQKARTGEALSFTAFVAACIGRAVELDKHVHAYRNWRNQLVIFDDVDALITIEIKAGDRTFPLVHTLRQINTRSVQELHAEIRAIQANPKLSVEGRPTVMHNFYYLPTFIRRLSYRLVERNPHWRKQFAGTVGLTSVGMFGTGSGWGLGMPNHTVAVTLGGIAQKPGVVAGRIEIREYLAVTVSFDHDIVDGAPAARFTQRLTALLEGGLALGNPATKGTGEETRDQ